MMKKLKLKSTEEFEDLFRNKTMKVTNHIVEGISHAMENNIKVADLYEVSFVLKFCIFISLLGRKIHIDFLPASTWAK